MDIMEALEQVQVVDRASCDEDDVDWWPRGFPYGVSTPNDGVIALFADEKEANCYRLDRVNTLLNRPAVGV